MIATAVRNRKPRFIVAGVDIGDLVGEIIPADRIVLLRKLVRFTKRLAAKRS